MTTLQIRMLDRVLAACACPIMKDPPADNGQSTNDAESNLESMMMHSNGESTSHTIDDSNGQSSMDVDRERSSMDVHTNGEPSVDDDNWPAPPHSHDHLAPSVVSSSMTVMRLELLGSVLPDMFALH